MIIYVKSKLAVNKLKRWKYSDKVLQLQMDREKDSFPSFKGCVDAKRKYNPQANEFIVTMKVEASLKQQLSQPLLLLKSCQFVEEKVNLSWMTENSLRI